MLTSHSINQTVSYCFAKRSGLDLSEVGDFIDFPNSTLINIVCLEDLEKGLINYGALNNLACRQWNMNEIDSEESLEFPLKKKKL